MGEKAGTIIGAILIITAIFTIVAFFLVSYLVYFNRRKTMLIAEKESQANDFEEQLLRSQVEMQEHTYNVLSKELHDNIGQLLSTAKMLIGLAERELHPPPDRLLSANAMLGTAINELRSLSKSLDKDWLKQFSFTENLNAAISRINEGHKIKVKFISHAAIALPPEQQLILFRIVQEAVQNAVKHAQPHAIMVATSEQAGGLIIRIEDDGNGFDAANAGGMGFVNMKHRTRLLGGTISWASVHGSGTVINIIIPFENPQI